MQAGRRELDIVVYGATGFVGRLTAEYLAKAGAGIRVGLAGRSSERLRAVRQSLGAAAADWPLIVADLTAPAALRAMASQTQVVVSAVGPYSRRGLPVVAACAATGTDYTDLTGEVPFVRDSIDRHHQAAIDNGARIVHSCGFDSIPSDLNVYALHRRILDDDAGELGETTFVLRSYSGGFSGGTVATMVDLMQQGWGDPTTRALLDDPYGLSPDRGAEPELGPQPDLPVRRGSDIAPELAGLWMCGYLMALYNTRCVRRSNALLGWPYGRGLRYSETLSMGSSVAAPIFATMGNLGLLTASRYGGGYLRMLPPGMLERIMPPSDIGYDKGANGYYKVQTYTTTTRGARYVATMIQQGDPGYAATAALVCQSAMILACQRDQLPDRRGVLTPVAAMGDALLARLPAAGVSIDVTALS